MEYVTHRRVSMRRDPLVSEQRLQERIIADPTLLGLGEVDVKDIEWRQAGAGRLDLLLHDPETNTRYEVELQLGAADESHIIRTIEYWDHERRRYPTVRACRCHRCRGHKSDSRTNPAASPNLE